MNKSLLIMSLVLCKFVGGVVRTSEEVDGYRKVFKIEVDSTPKAEFVLYDGRGQHIPYVDKKAPALLAILKESIFGTTKYTANQIWDIYYIVGYTANELQRTDLKADLVLLFYQFQGEVQDEDLVQFATEVTRKYKSYNKSDNPYLKYKIIFDAKRAGLNPQQLQILDTHLDFGAVLTDSNELDSSKLDVTIKECKERVRMALNRDAPQDESE